MLNEISSPVNVSRETYICHSLIDLHEIDK